MTHLLFFGIRATTHLQLPGTDNDTEAATDIVVQDRRSIHENKHTTQAVQSYYRAAALQNAQKKNGLVGEQRQESGDFDSVLTPPSARAHRRKQNKQKQKQSS